MTDAPVVVVGAGPVGLVAALGLGAAGVPALVLESGGPAVAAEWRGSTIHPPTIEILDRLELAAGALDGGVRVDRLQYRDLVLDDVVELRYDAIADRTRFPFRLQYEQYKLLRDLRQAAAASDRVDVRYDARAVNVAPGGPDGPARVELADGRSVTARAVVAADGSHSEVRRALSVPMHGDTYKTLSLVVATDTPFDELRPGLGPVSYWAGPAGRVSLIRTPDTWRVALSTNDRAESSASPGDVTIGAGGVHPRFTEAMRLLVGPRWIPQRIRQHQAYRSHQRVAARFAVGRVALVGDAAHLTATTGGMGLNSGIHDAYELVRRLVPALAGGDELEAIAAYAEVRRGVAAELVQPATRTSRAAVELRDEDARRDRLARLAAVATDPVAVARHLAAAAMLDAVEL